MKERSRRAGTGRGAVAINRRKVQVGKWKTLKPIWIRLGEGLSWANAITFGPALEQLYDAADSFGAKEIVWLEKKTGRPNSRYAQDLSSGKKWGEIDV